MPKILYCSFCAKSQHAVRKLVAGPSVYICDECVELCVDIIRDGILWKVLSRLRGSKEKKNDAYQAALEQVRSVSTEEVVSYVEQGKVEMLDRRQTVQLIDRRLSVLDGEVPQQDDALASRLPAHLHTKSKQELIDMRTNAERELTHYEDAFRIGTTVLAERRQGDLVRP